jgi:hypothetical protein
MRKFMHALFDALRNAGDASGSNATSAGTNASTATAAGSPTVQAVTQYSGAGVALRVQALLQQLSGGNTASSAIGSSPDLGNLNTAFQTLMQDISAGSSAGAGGSQPTLKAFLTQLQGTLLANAPGALGASGNVVDTTA